MKVDSEVLIVGAGPVGLTLGCLLQSYGIRCRVIEKHQQRLQQSRAFSLHARTVELLDILGLGGWIRSDACQVERMTIYSGKQPILNFNFSQLITQGDPCVFSYPQHRLEQLLEARFLALGGDLRYDTELRTLAQLGDQVVAEVSHQGAVCQETFRYLVGCDGKGSRVRELAGILFEGKSYANRFLVCDGVLAGSVVLSAEDLAQGHTYLTANGYVMLFPLPGGLHRVVVDLEGEASTATRDALEATLAARLQQMQQSDLHFAEIRWISEASLASCLADCYVSGRVLLAGDACHVHSPIGGQGINLGIQDAFNLAWKLSLVCKGHSDEPLLQSYQQERRAIAASVLKQTDRMHRLFTSPHPVKAMVRDRLLPVVGSLPSVNRKQVMTISGLGHDYCDRRLIPLARAGARQGSRIGNLTLLCQGKPVGLYEFLTTYKFLIVGYGVEGPPPVIPDFMQRHVDFLQVGVTDEADSTYQFEKSQQELKQHHGIAAPCYLFIRPDGYLQAVAEMMPVFDALCEIRNFLIKNHILITG